MGLYAPVEGLSFKTFDAFACRMCMEVDWIAALKCYEAGEDGGKERRRAAVRSVSTTSAALLQSTKREMILTNQTEGR